MYNRALGLVPRSAATLTSLAFTAQLRGDNTTAVELYHVALGLRPDDRCVRPRGCDLSTPACVLNEIVAVTSFCVPSFAQEMLTAALEEECATSI
jgi:hypothetical protein